MTEQDQITLDRWITNAKVQLYFGCRAAVGHDRIHWLMMAVASLSEAKKLLARIAARVSSP